MRIQILQETLKRGLSLAGHAVAARSSLPVLANILLTAKDGQLTLDANNLEIGITAQLGAQVHEDGAVTLPAKLLTDLVSNLPKDVIELELDDKTQTVTFRCRGTKASIKGIEADEFPAVLELDTSAAPIATLPPGLLREVIAQVAFAAAQEHTNPVLQGVLLRLVDNHATFAAIDGYRLSVRHMELEQPVSTPVDFIIPARALVELSRTVSDLDSPIELYATANGAQVIFHTDTVDFSSRVIDGNFPDYERFVPQPSNDMTRTVFDTDAFRKAIKRINLFSQAAGNLVALTIEDSGGDKPGRVLLTATAAEVGDTQDHVEALVDGDGGKTGLNGKYLAEALSVFDCDQIALEYTSANAPSVFRPVGGADYLHLIMPVRIP